MFWTLLCTYDKLNFMFNIYNYKSSYLSNYIDNIYARKSIAFFLVCAHKYMHFCFDLSFILNNDSSHYS